MKFFKSFLLLFVFISLFAGVKWETTIVSQGKSGTSTIKTTGYAEGDFVRIEYVDVQGKETMSKKGEYWLYDTKKNVIFIVDNENKEYIEIPMNDLSSLMKGIGDVVKIDIKNPKIEIKQIGEEIVNGYKCNHYLITKSYETEMSVMIMKVKMRTEEAEDVWATNEDLFSGISRNYVNSKFKSGLKALDDMIDKEIETYKITGFPIKIISIRKTYDNQNKLTEEHKTETNVTKIVKENINPSMFTIPSDYKKSELKLQMEKDNE
uniref:DUF4412 domain-containing protein n=1 Tax=candidate division WOR-3 bacterium TaxID=2052148 RepID=A0A7C4UGC3_UNCW3